MPTKGNVSLDIEQAVLAALTKEPQLTIDIVKKSGMSKSSVENHLHRLAKCNKVNRIKITSLKGRFGYSFRWQKKVTVT